MGKKQTRRTISFRAEIHDAISRAAEECGESMSQWCERHLVDALVCSGVDIRPRDEVLREQDMRAIQEAHRRANLGRYYGAHFSW